MLEKMKEQKLLSNEEIASFCSQAAMLFQAGIPPVESMGIMLSDTKSASGKALIKSILEVCQTGEPFWKALESTGVFPDYVIHMLTLGEESGNLDVCMSSLANYYEKEDNIASGIKSAITYPFIMIAMMAVIIFVLISKVMPIFNQVFIELGSEMNGFSASLLKLGSNLNRYSVVFLALVALLILVYLFSTRTQSISSDIVTMQAHNDALQVDIETLSSSDRVEGIAASNGMKRNQDSIITITDTTGKE